MRDAQWSLLVHSICSFGDDGAVDKLDLRISSDVKLSPQFAFIMNQDLGKLSWGTRLYERHAKLSRLGWELNLNLNNKRDGHHKLEMLGVGKMKLSRILERVRKVFDVDPYSLEIMRVDLKADTGDFSVTWFHENARVKQKRYCEEYGHFHAEHKNFESLYLGKRPSVFRIYDRLRYMQIDYKRLKRRSTYGSEMPTFEEFSGYSKDVATLTRVERQYGSDHIPASISTLGKLRSNAAALTPFEPLQFLPGVISDESLNTLHGEQFLKGHAVLRLLEQHGYQEARKLLEQKTSRNALRLLDQIKNGMETTLANTPPDLDTIYREAVIRQLTS